MIFILSQKSVRHFYMFFTSFAFFPTLRPITFFISQSWMMMKHHFWLHKIKLFSFNIRIKPEAFSLHFMAKYNICYEVRLRLKLHITHIILKKLFMLNILTFAAFTSLSVSYCSQCHYLHFLPKVLRHIASSIILGMIFLEKSISVKCWLIIISRKLHPSKMLKVLIVEKIIMMLNFLISMT